MKLPHIVYGGVYMSKLCRTMILAYCVVFVAILAGGAIIGRTATVFSENEPLKNRTCFIIDAGHGGIDGGAVSCTGKYESHINLEISVRLNDLLHLMGYETVMIRTEDISIHTSGQTIAAKKASDLKERVRIVNETQNGILLSIHQNYYSDSSQYGGQMFYAKTSGSDLLAKNLQTNFCTYLNTGNNRKIKPVQGIYLMKHIEKPGVLIECGFISNYAEAMKLQSDSYQKKLCAVIAVSCSNYCEEMTVMIDEASYI